MKNNRFLAFFAVALCLVMVSCQKDKKVFHLHFNETDAKAYIDQNHFFWSNGDAIKINDGVGTVTVSGREATIEAEVEDAVRYYAFFPANYVDSRNGSSRFNFTLPASQNYVVDGGKQKIMSPMVAHTNTDNLDFHNLGALLKVQVPGNTDVKSIVVETTENHYLSGAAEVDATSTSFTFSSGLPEVKLANCSPRADGTYYVVVPPMMGETHFKVTVNYMEGGEYKSDTRTQSQGVTLLRNQVGPLVYNSMNGTGINYNDADVYYQVEYVLNYENGPSDKTYINTGYVPQYHSRYMLDFSIMRTTEQWTMGLRLNGTTKALIAIGGSTSNQQFRLRYGTEMADSPASFTRTVGQRYRFTIAGVRESYGDRYRGEFSYVNTTNPEQVFSNHTEWCTWPGAEGHPLYLCAYNDLTWDAPNNAHIHDGIKVYSFVIWDEGFVLRRNFVPVIKKHHTDQAHVASTEVGLYDKVEGRFYGSAYPGRVFTAGAETGDIWN